MAWELRQDRPIYLQLIETIEQRIITGQYPAGSWLPGVRELAAEAGVNPNTMQKALSELERRELCFAQRTNGRTITEDEEMIKQLQHQIALEQIEEFLRKMKDIGLTREEVIALMNTKGEA